MLIILLRFVPDVKDGDFLVLSFQIALPARCRWKLIAPQVS
jgi:hypothetical protein